MSMDDEIEPSDTRAEPPAEPPSGTPGESDARYQDADDQAARRRREVRVGSERIGAYAEAMKVVGDLLHPAHGGDDVVPRRRSRLDPLLRGDLELALRAMAADLRRLATEPGRRGS